MANQHERFVDEVDEDLESPKIDGNSNESTDSGLERSQDDKLTSSNSEARRKVEENSPSEDIIISQREQKLRCIKHAMMTFVFLSMVTVGVLALSFPHLREEFLGLLVWFQKDPFLTFPIYSLITTVAVLLGFPLMLFEVVAGYLFPVFIVIPTIIAERLLIVNCGYFLSRNLLQGTIGGIIEKRRSMKTFKRAVHTEEAKFLALAQLAYIPFWMKIYGLPLFVKTKLLYVCVALLCSSPTSAIYVIIGSHASNFESVISGECFKDSNFKSRLIIFGICALLLLITYSCWLSRKIKNELKRFEEKEVMPACDCSLDSTMMK